MSNNGKIDATVVTALAEKIRRQDYFIKELQAELEQARQASIYTMLGQLRLREAVLLYVGKDADTFMQRLAETFGSDIATAVSLSLFTLENVESHEARETIRNAINPCSKP